MTTVFITSGSLENEYINKKQSEVYETEYFEHTIKFTETILPTEELISSVWELSGDIPLYVKLDGLTLKGNIEMLQDQVIDVPRYPKEKIKPDGSNWQNNGRPIDSTIEFNFNIIKIDKVKDIENDTVSEVRTETPVNITLTKNYNIDNMVFVKNYLDEGNTLKIGNDDYTKKHFSYFLQVHPGPFKV